jgi:hypothetical protein
MTGRPFVFAMDAAGGLLQMLAGWKPAMPGYPATKACVAKPTTRGGKDKLFAAGLFEELEMTRGFGIAFACGGVEQHAGLIAILRNALAEAIQLGESDFGVGVAFFDGGPEQTSGFSLVVMGFGSAQ